MTLTKQPLILLDMLIGFAVLIVANVLVGTLLLTASESIAKYFFISGLVVADILTIISFLGGGRGGSKL